MEVKDFLDYGMGIFSLALLGYLLMQQRRQAQRPSIDPWPIVERNTAAMSDAATASREAAATNRELVTYMQAEREGWAAQQQVMANTMAQLAATTQTVLADVRELMGMQRGMR